MHASLSRVALATDLARAAKDNARRAGVPALVSESAVMEAHGLALMSEHRAAWPPFASLDRPLRLRRIGIGRSGLHTSTAPTWRRSSGTASVTWAVSEAERFARRSLDMIDGYDRGRLFNLALLASILAGQGRVDEACETGLAAVRLAAEVQSVRTVAYLVDLSHRLAPFRAEPAVQVLDERIGLLAQRDSEA